MTIFQQECKGLHNSASVATFSSSGGSGGDSSDLIEESTSNNLATSFLAVEDFVRRSSGSRTIKTVLIANNGIAAVKCMRSIRRWSYETFHVRPGAAKSKLYFSSKSLSTSSSEKIVDRDNRSTDHVGQPNAERMIKFVVMVTPEDMNANAEYIGMADQVCQVPGGSNNNNYANVDLIVDVARRYGVHAVWAGWGHASENPKLPDQLNRHGITFLGPSSDAMWLLGDKIASTIVAQTVGMPTVPWSGSSLKADLPDEMTSPHNAAVPSPLGRAGAVELVNRCFQDACISTVDAGIRVANSIGYPVMIKASEGGGGKGIRKAGDDAEFSTLFHQVMSEVPGSPIFVMKHVNKARHVEVQIIADSTGQAISLFGRDCSIQRRHQKIVEEAPVVVVPRETFQTMEEAAVRLATAVGYESAGTVEYLYDEDGHWYFLELNPRLQVEHPCSEMLTNVNLPAIQLLIGMGIPLQKIHCIRQLFKIDPSSSGGGDSVDFSKLQHLAEANGHVIAARITSENPDDGFLPSSGAVRQLNFKSSKNVWGYFSVGSRGNLHEFADSQFGHCFSWGKDREQARHNLVLALKELSIRCDFKTIIEHLVMILERREFIENSYHTGWLDGMIARNERSQKPNLFVALICCSVGVAIKTIEHNFSAFRQSLDRGQIIPPPKFLKNSVSVDLIRDDIKYPLDVTQIGTNRYLVRLHSTAHAYSVKDVDVFKLDEDQSIVTVDRLTHTSSLSDLKSTYNIRVGYRSIDFQKKEVDPSRQLSPSPGKLIKFLIEDGTSVCRGNAFCEIEVMKMLTTLRASMDGILRHRISVGSSVEDGTLLAQIETPESDAAESTRKTGNSQLAADQSMMANRRSCTLYAGPGFPDNVVDIDNFANNDGEIVPETFDHNPINPSSSQRLAHTLEEFLRTKQTLLASIDGFCAPYDVYRDMVDKCVENLFRHLNDPHLPLAEMYQAVAAAKGRALPIPLERAIYSELKVYEANITSVLMQFPAGKIEQLIYRAQNRLSETGQKNLGHNRSASLPQIPAQLASKSDDANRESGPTMFTDSILAVCRKYSRGTKGHLLRTVEEFMNTFLRAEQPFQHGHYDKVILSLRDRVKSSGANAQQLTNESLAKPMAKVNANLNADSITGDVSNLEDIVKLVYAKTQNKNRHALILRILDYLERREPRTLHALRHVLVNLASLRKAENSAVILKARTLLILSEKPSFEIRRNQMEKILLDSIAHGSDFTHDEDDEEQYEDDGEEESGEGDVEDDVRSGGGRSIHLRQLITSDGSTVFDVLGSFFHHAKSDIRAVAMEVYIRRVYMSYAISSLVNVTLSADDSNDAGAVKIPLVLFEYQAPVEQFSLLIRSNLPGDTPESKSCCHGIMCAFRSFRCLESSFQRIMSKFGPHFQSVAKASVSAAESRRSGGDEHHILILAIHIADEMTKLNLELDNDETCLPLLSTFCAANIDALQARSIDRVTFLLQRDGQLPRYFTFRASSKFQEDKVCRHIDPCLTFQLELHRLSNYKLEPLMTSNPQMHIYLAESRDRVGTGSGSSDCRFFIRSIVTNSDLISARASLDYLKIEGERLLNESLDELEVAYHTFADHAARSTANHIFLNFVPAVRLNVDEIADDVNVSILSRYGWRLAKLKVKSAEIRMVVRRPAPPPATFMFPSSVKGRRRRQPRQPDETSHVSCHPSVVGDNEESCEEDTVLRLVINHDASFLINMFIYKEITVSADSELIVLPPTVDSSQIRLPLHQDERVKIFRSVGMKCGPWNGWPVDLPYQLANVDETQRSIAHRMNTTYVHDYPELIKMCLKDLWNEHCSYVASSSTVKTSSMQDITSPPDNALLTVKKLELTCDTTMHEKEDSTQKFGFGDRLGDQICLKEVNTDSCAYSGPQDYASLDKVAMVAWKMTARTPQYPDGRDFIVIANDISIQIGTFGPREDLLFLHASRLARKLKVPRIYFAANSGARIGISEELWQMVKVAWIDKSRPAAGYHYLYLDSKDYAMLSEKAESEGKSVDDIVRVERISLPTPAPHRGEADEEFHFRIHDIIGLRGKAEAIGVENLQHAGMIAGETALAYNEIVTMSMVSARAVGIGAYLVRLGQRIIQIDNSTILLTGAEALNKVLGREVYTSNLQLGGVQIMYSNGISHCTEPTDVDGVRRLLKWLSYIPASKGQPLPIYSPRTDPVDRPPSFVPPSDGSPYDPRLLINGLFDVNSFDEILAGWAKTVVVGRARLGGIPIGVIAVETRQVKLSLLADPADASSEEKLVNQAGQVWYPDSAFKTAQAIQDFDHEDLPLIILANWRGFSGGMMDMFEQVLKFGAQIVMALEKFTSPILIYIPPYGELRGGSWVVIDPSINRFGQADMFADSLCRGSILEPEGLVSVKIKASKQAGLMNRLLQPGDKVDHSEANLRSVLQRIAVNFADLHDTPTRMLSTGAVHDVVQWRLARPTLYWRLRRRLAINELIRQLSGRQEVADVGSLGGRLIGKIARLYSESSGEDLDQVSVANDERVAVWAEGLISDTISTAKQQSASDSESSNNIDDEEKQLAEEMERLRLKYGDKNLLQYWLKTKTNELLIE